MSVDYQIYDLGNLTLQRGATLRDCKLAYKTFGQLNAAKDNVIVYPTWYSGQHYDNEWLIGPGMALADTYGIGGGDHSPWAWPIYVVSALALAGLVAVVVLLLRGPAGGLGAPRRRA